MNDDRLYSFFIQEILKTKKSIKNNIINTHVPITKFCRLFIGCHISFISFFFNSKKQCITNTVELPLISTHIVFSNRKPLFPTIY